MISPTVKGNMHGRPGLGPATVTQLPVEGGVGVGGGGVAGGRVVGRRVVGRRVVVSGSVGGLQAETILTP